MEAMTHLLIDIGNSSVKVALSVGGKISKSQRIAHSKMVDDICHLAKNYGAAKAAVSSVATDPSELCQALYSTGLKVICLNADTPLPFRLGYNSPDTLGTDRMAAVAGAMALHPQRNILVADAGSCITYEFLTADGIYLGGNIAPGLSMRLRAMHEHTARLPMATPEGEVPPIGYTTDTALRTGALMGLRHEVEGYLRYMQDRYDNPLVVLTGGDAKYIAPLMETKAEIDEWLVMRGLDYIIMFNEKMTDGEKK